MKFVFSKIVQCCFVLFFAPSICGACGGNENTPTNTLKQAITNSSIVFIGNVTSIETSPGKDVVANFEVIRSWKNLKNEKLSFRIETGRSCDLGKYVQAGSHWFIIANENGEKIWTASHSKRLFDLKEEEKKAKEIDAIK